MKLQFVEQLENSEFAEIGEMTNQEILRIAMAQSAVDLSADASDFEKSENVVVTSHRATVAFEILKEQRN